MNGSIEDVELDPDYFDVVVLKHVLEHLVDPKNTLKKIYSVLKKGGILVMCVPNEFDCLYSRLMLNNLLFYFQPRKRPTDHLYFFNRRTIRLLLGINGFRVIQLKTGNFWINTNHKNRYGVVGDVAKKTFCWFADLLEMGDVMNVVAVKG